MRGLTYSDVESIRETPGRSLLLFITHRCPVGCAHCSVDSRRDSATISDFPLFQSLVRGICDQTDLTMVGISGGEPFVERRGLAFAVDALAQAGKLVVLYTSGVWANARVPKWIRDVLRQASCVFLSTDSFHAATVDDERYIHAARYTADAGVWIVVQVLDTPGMAERADNLLRRAFDGPYDAYAEIHLIAPRTWGRGTTIFTVQRRRKGEDFGVCKILTSPVVRYDGIVSPCCNEGLLMGHGPDRLRTICANESELSQALAHYRDDSVLASMQGIGLGALTKHPRFTDLATRPFTNVCELCWEIQARALPLDDHSDQLLGAMAAMT